METELVQIRRRQIYERRSRGESHEQISKALGISIRTIQRLSGPRTADEKKRIRNQKSKARQRLMKKIEQRLARGDTYAAIARDLKVSPGRVAEIERKKMEDVFIEVEPYWCRGSGKPHRVFYRPCVICEARRYKAANKLARQLETAGGLEVVR